MDTKTLFEMLGQKEPELITDAERAREFPRRRMDNRTEGLDLEAPELFVYEGLTFEEMAEAISEDVIRMHCTAVVQNRFSQEYLELSRLLERGISELASCCVTKAAFEKQGVRFRGLKDLNLSKYYTIVSGHFRKCHAAIGETTVKNRQFWRQMMDMEFRWYSLARRLKATEDRIKLIREGKISIDKMLEKLDYDRTYERTAQPKPGKKSGPKGLPSPKAISFPVMGDFLRDKSGVAVSREKEAVPAAAPEKEAEPKFYGSMKQRKKAERLARKRAAAQPRNASSRHMPETVPDDTLSEEYIPDLLSKGISLPGRV